MKTRAKQRANRKLKLAMLDRRDACGVYDPTPYEAVKDGVKVRQKQWISTGLKDTAENVKKASEMRARQLNTKHTDVSTDRNITLADYIDNFLNKKKREFSMFLGINFRIKANG